MYMYFLKEAVVIAYVGIKFQNRVGTLALLSGIGNLKFKLL